MRIGIPRETKTLEGRVALVPAACADLVRRGYEVWVEAGGAEVRLLAEDGRELPQPACGYQHFGQDRD